MTANSKFIPITLVTLVLTGCIIHVGSADGHNSESKAGNYHHGADISYVNDNIVVKAEQQVGDIDSVNGDISLDSHAVARDIDSVNGDINLEDATTVGDIESVNGNIRIADGAKVDGSIDTVNGDIRLQSTDVTGDIKTLNGNLHVSGASQIHGDIVYEKPSKKWWNFGRDQSSAPRLTLEHGVTVDGLILLHQPVKLEISDPELLKKVREDFRQ